MRKRNDIRIVSDGDTHAPLIEDYDVKVVTLFAPTHMNSLTTLNPPSAPTAPVDNVRFRMSHILSYQASTKTKALRPTPANPEPLIAPMVPLVISTGGLMEKQMEAKLKEWKQWGMPKGLHTWMMTAIGVGLAKARGRLMIAT
jgi:hypothetical protein